jgi:AcrR family transcriptional regulator
MAKPNMVTKQDLIRSAQKCIQEKGLDKLTFKEVAQGAGVTQGTVYYHFKTKEQLMFEIVQSVCHGAWQAVEASRTAGSLEETIIHALEAARSRCTYGSSYHTLFFSLVVHSLQNDALREQLHQMLERENAHVDELLAKLFPASDSSGRPFTHGAIMINALIDGLALQALLNPAFPAEQIYSELISYVKQLLSAQSAIPSEKEE